MTVPSEVFSNGHSEVFGRGNSGEYVPVKFVLCLGIGSRIFGGKDPTKVGLVVPD